MPLKYDHNYNNFNFSALVSIYYADGTVAISHGGIEMGQGIHTRVSIYQPYSNGSFSQVQTGSNNMSETFLQSIVKYQ